MTLCYKVNITLTKQKKKFKKKENKIPDTSGFVKNTYSNTKITEREGKIPDISNLTTKTESTLENKIPSVSNLAKKQTIILKVRKLKINLIIIIMINILILQNLIN